MKKRTSFNVWNADGGSFFGNCAANVCPWRSWRGSWRITGGHAVRGHAAAGHVRGGHAGFRARGGRGHQFARAARGNARFAGRAYNWNGGRHWGGVTGEAITGIRPMDILGSAITVWAMAIHTTELAITVIATVGTIRIRLRILPLPLRILAVRDLQLRV